MQSVVSPFTGVTPSDFEGWRGQADMKYQTSFALASNLPVFNLGLADMLDEVDDLLFVLDSQGRALNFKARNGAGMSHFTPAGLSVWDMVPLRARQKYEIAFHQVLTGSRFAMFEVMLTLRNKGACWFEFRLLPTIDRNFILFIWNVGGYRSLSKTIANIPFSVHKMIEGWSRALYLRDHETEDHTRRVTAMTLQLARLLGVPEQEMADIRRGAVLHDIGKIAIPDEILLKEGKLSPEEWGVMKRHPLIAVELLETIPDMGKAMVIPRWHHEKWDGSGYPDGLKGAGIPLYARIFALADVFDALTSDRPYRRAWSGANALIHIEREAGRHFDPELAPAFVEMIANANE
jgi:HD-GYP domain-containing protein (c-di-GMP phosphodiesterase class II)